MKSPRHLFVGMAASLALGATAPVALAQPFGMGPGMMHGMEHGAAASGHGPMAGAVGMLTRQDEGSSADMGLVHDLVMNNTRIKRTVTNLPNGIKTVTESDDPQVARAIKAHVASMSQRLKDGREFNIFSTTLPVLFENRDKIQSVVEVTEKGSVVTRTSTDPKVVAALQGHAAEVTELVQEGMVAMRRGMMSRMAMGPSGPRAASGPTAGPTARRAPASNDHAQ
ncbi:MAG: hypothetical protein HYY78_03095 [Betaproteobacteria bacterium]|nr:hypothetical protein [Betaproteobacteria bacterium]